LKGLFVVGALNMKGVVVAVGVVWNENGAAAVGFSVSAGASFAPKLKPVLAGDAL
jgi:hypothetical protein